MTAARPIAAESSSSPPPPPPPARLVASALRPLPSRRRGLLQWLGVISTLAFAAFLGMFSLDEPVFSLGFLMHNIPAIIVLIGALLGWWRAWAGAAWLAVAGVAAIIFMHDGWQHWTWPLVINVPPLVLAALFAAAAALRR